MNDPLYSMLHAEATADRTKALLSLDLLSNKAAGIGDHSTEDFWKNARESLNLLGDADGRLRTLKKYFVEKNEGA
tara:strand:- start:310 stop:534 length:225 start_codon:yes stop_codon:yes gene_type:complete